MAQELTRVGGTGTHPSRVLSVPSRSPRYANKRDTGHCPAVSCLSCFFAGPFTGAHVEAKHMAARLQPPFANRGMSGEKTMRTTTKTLYERTTTKERMAMCDVVVRAIKTAVPVGITLQEANLALASAGLTQLNNHEDWIGLMEHQWEFRHGWDGSLSNDGRLNGPWPQEGKGVSYWDGYYYDANGQLCSRDGRIWD